MVALYDRIKTWDVLAVGLTVLLLWSCRLFLGYPRLCQGSPVHLTCARTENVPVQGITGLAKSNAKATCTVGLFVTNTWICVYICRKILQCIAHWPGSCWCWKDCIHCCWLRGHCGQGCPPWSHITLLLTQTWNSKRSRFRFWIAAWTLPLLASHLTTKHSLNALLMLTIPSTGRLAVR